MIVTGITGGIWIIEKKEIAMTIPSILKNVTEAQREQIWEVVKNNYKDIFEVFIDPVDTFREDLFEICRWPHIYINERGICLLIAHCATFEPKFMEMFDFSTEIMFEHFIEYIKHKPT